MAEWMTEMAYPVMKAVNIALFFMFAPDGKKPGLVGRAIYRGLVKLVVLEFRMKSRIMEHYSAC